MSEGIVRHGWLKKQSGGKSKKPTVGNALAKWDKRYFELNTDGQLKYFKRAGDDAPAGALDVTGASVAAMDDGITFSVGTDSRKLTLRADAAADRDEWVRYAVPPPIPWTKTFVTARRPQPLGREPKDEGRCSFRVRCEQVAS